MTRQVAILVTGMHRSGTSATAGALGLLGVDLGRHLMPPGSDNPKGYFESERAVAINERLLARLGSRWDDVRPLPEGWADGEAAMDAVREIDALIGSEFSGAPLWAVKDPRLCRLMPVWLAALEGRDVDATALFVVRHPTQVAASIHARNGWAPGLGELLWLRYMLEAEAATRHLARSAITYDALLADAQSSLRTAVARMGIQLPTPEPLGLETFIDPADRHQRQRGREQGANPDPFAPIIAHVHRALVRVAEGEDAWMSIDAAQRDFAREWAASGSRISAVADMAAAFDSAANAAREAAAKSASELRAQEEWARLAVEKHEALLADNARLNELLTSQIKWSESAVREREALQAEVARLRSELSAQLAWSEQAVQKEEELQAELAQTRSDLAAQLAWAESAVREREALQAEVARLGSELSAQLAWSERAVQKEEEIQAAFAQARSDLAAQVAWAEDSMREREALQATADELRADLSRQREALQRVVEEREQCQAHATSLRAELSARTRSAAEAAAEWKQQALRYEADIAAVRSVAGELERTLSSMESSYSWRITRPLRALSGMFGKNDKGNRQG